MIKYSWFALLVLIAVTLQGSGAPNQKIISIQNRTHGEVTVIFQPSAKTAVLCAYLYNQDNMVLWAVRDLKYDLSVTQWPPVDKRGRPVTKYQNASPSDIREYLKSWCSQRYRDDPQLDNLKKAMEAERKRAGREKILTKFVDEELYQGSTSFQLHEVKDLSEEEGLALFDNDNSKIAFYRITDTGIQLKSVRKIAADLELAPLSSARTLSFPAPGLSVQQVEKEVEKLKEAQQRREERDN